MSVLGAPGSARRRSVLLLGVILAAAVVLRWPGLFEGPGYSNRDELMYVPKAIRYGGGDLNPHYFQNPPLAGYLMFGVLGLWYAVGRATGAFTTPLDFKAQYLADPSPAFVVARSVPLLFGLATIAAVFVLARRLLPKDADPARRDFAGAVAATFLAVSPMHCERSATATNEALVTFLVACATLAALRLARSGALRDAVVAGLLVGSAAGAKYTGVLVCIPVGLAALVAERSTFGGRVKLALAAGAASVAAFVVTCPWSVLDHTTFRTHLDNLVDVRDRGPDLAPGAALWRSIGNYAGDAWATGFGPVACLMVVLGIVCAVMSVVRGPTDRRRAAAVVLAATIPTAAYLISHTTMANGRYLLPAYPAFLAMGAAGVASFDGAPGLWLRRLTLVGAVVWATLQAMALPLRIERARAVDTQTAMAEWMHASVPDGAHVVGDWHAPRLPSIAARREFDGKVSATTTEKLRPAYQLTTAYDYFALPLNRLDGTSVAADDFDAMSALGPVYMLTSNLGEQTFDALPPGDYPGRAWYPAVRSRCTLVHEVAPGPGFRGPTLRLYRAR
ncbi:MAG: glycosyltransferase family 39 protein [Planctomycetes bacterium]|nr:glycosyltransferase family 39 protein [Planctomycetota bacterium]